MASLALYRKYRPTDFDELFGQEHISKTLKNSVKSGNFSHAYLFFGPRGTGKTSAARILAKAINCLKNMNGNPDNKCNNCDLINKSQTTDIIEIDAASHTQVDNIREIIVDRANFAPTNLNYKVYIIDEAHMLSKSSFNALLKTLEEPPSHAIFIFATTEINKIPPTILSRCQRYDFRRIRIADIVKRLREISEKEKIEVSEEVLEIIAETSEGGFRDAISLLDQAASSFNNQITKDNIENIIGITDTKIVEDYIYAISNKKANEAIQLISRAVDDGYEPSQFLRNILELLRKMLFASVSNIEEVDLSENALKRTKELLKLVNTSDILEFIDILIASESKYKNSTLPQLGLEMATIKICFGQLGDSQKKEIQNKNNTQQESLKTSQPKEETIPKTGFEAAKWQEFLAEIKSKNNSVYAFLKVCTNEITEDEIILTFPFKFHKERVEEQKNLEILVRAAEKVYKRKFIVKCLFKPHLNNSMEQQKPRKDDLLDDALEIFGGEIIE